MTANRKPIIDRFFGRPVVWGATMTGAFYYVINRDEFHGSWLHRYTSEHAIEYIIVALFFWSIADLAKKCNGPLKG